MLNQLMLIGRIEKISENGKITIAVSRNFKNENGIYEVDNIQVKLFNDLAINVIEYCKIGDLIGVKGRIQATNENIEIIAEKITFLSSNKEEK